MKHDLMKNYTNADGAGDGEMQRDILISELAKLIVNSPQRVRNHLHNMGFKVSAKPSKTELANLVSAALLKSEGFAKLLSADIISGSYSFNVGGQMGPPTMDYTAPAPTTTKKAWDWTEFLKSSADLVNGFGKIFGGKPRADADKARADADKAATNTDANKDLLAAIAAMDKQPANMGLYIGVGILVIVVVVVLIVKSRK